MESRRARRSRLPTGQPAPRATIGAAESSETHDRLAAIRRAVREPGVSPGRSRRCEGRRSRAERHWPPGKTSPSREGGEGGSPESEDLPVAAKSNPSRKEDSC